MGVLLLGPFSNLILEDEKSPPLVRFVLGMKATALGVGSISVNVCVGCESHSIGGYATTRFGAFGLCMMTYVYYNLN